MLLTCVSTTPDLMMRRMNSFAVSLKRQINCISTRISSGLATMSTSSRAIEKGGPDSRTFQDAVRTLNELQSNAEVIKIITANRTALQGDSLPGTIKYLRRSGMELEELDQLNVIHVAGTKGKGSTSAFVESILRHAGLKTGFFSSPHLISVRERIRLNGKPISQEKFTRYFFQAYDGMDQFKKDAHDMPSYFRFLTCMAFKLFLDEKVDVAVVEVGIGGMYDSTNIIRKPVVTGITALGLDHQTILGESAEEIALQKAGIMKTGVPAITVPSHSPSVRKVLEDFANKIQSPLVIAPELKSYGNINGIKLGIGNADISGMNAALAIQLANAFISQKCPGKFQDDSNKNSSVILGQPCPLQSWHLDGLKNCVWPGRFQVLRRSEKLAFYLDGAHTLESFDAALSWFREASPPDSFRTLVFHLTGFRKADAFLEPFVKSHLFSQVIFCPIVLSSNVRPTSEIWSKVESEEDLRQKCQSHAKVWERAEAGSVAESKAKLEVLDSLESMLNYAESLADEKFSTTGKEVSILVTGSLHLVGTFLSLIDPHSCD